MTYESKVESGSFFNNRFFTFIAALLTLLLFLFIIIFVYIPLRPQAIDTDIVAERKKTLSEVQSFQKKVATSYMWSDKEKGIVVIPVEQAMELVVKEYNTPAMEKKWAKAREEVVAVYKAKLEDVKKPEEVTITSNTKSSSKFDETAKGQEQSERPATQKTPAAPSEKNDQKVQQSRPTASAQTTLVLDKNGGGAHTAVVQYNT